MKREPVRDPDIEARVDLAHDPELDAAIVEALERRPPSVIAPDFARRVAMAARTEGVRPVRTQVSGSYGSVAAWTSLCVLLAVVVLLSPRALGPDGLHGQNPLLLLEGTLIVQAMALVLWLGSRAFPSRN